MWTRGQEILEPISMAASSSDGEPGAAEGTLEVAEKRAVTSLEFLLPGPIEIGLKADEPECESAMKQGFRGDFGPRESDVTIGDMDGNAMTRCCGCRGNPRATPAPIHFTFAGAIA